MTNSCSKCLKLPTESYEMRLLLVEKLMPGTIRLVVLQILTLVHINYSCIITVFYNSFYLLSSFSIETNICHLMDSNIS